MDKKGFEIFPAVFKSYLERIRPLQVPIKKNDRGRPTEFPNLPRENFIVARMEEWIPQHEPGARVNKYTPLIGHLGGKLIRMFVCYSLADMTSLFDSYFGWGRDEDKNIKLEWFRLEP